jgi:hypothetical protein
MRVGVKLTILYPSVTALFGRTTENSGRFLSELDWSELIPSRTSAEEIHIHVR